MKESITVENVIGRLRTWLKKNGSGIQPIPEFRLEIFMYNFGDIPKYQAYNTYYGKDNNPINVTKDDYFSDAIVQFFLYLISLDVDIEKSLKMGLVKLENMEFSKKKAPHIVRMESDK